MATLGQAFVTLGTKDDALRRGLKDAHGLVNSSVSSMQRTLSSLVIGVGLGALIKSTVDTAAAFEQLEVSLRTTEGSAQKAQAAMAWITEFAAKTPFELAEVGEAFKRLSAQGMNPREMLRPLGDAASAMSKTLNQAVEMFNDAVRGENERLKEFGVVAKKEGDTITYRWSQNGQNMVTTAKNNASDITNALTGIFGRFAGGMEAQSQTWKGQMSNMADSWHQFQNEIMNSGGLFDMMKAGVTEFNKEIQKLKSEGKLKEWASDIASGVVSAFRGMTEAAMVFGTAINNIRASWTGFQINMAESQLEALQKTSSLKNTLASGVVPGSPVGRWLADSQKANAEEQQRLIDELYGDKGLYQNLSGIKETQDETVKRYDEITAAINRIANAASEGTKPVEGLVGAVSSFGSPDAGGGEKKKTGKRASGPLGLSDIDKQIMSAQKSIMDSFRTITDASYDMNIAMAEHSGKYYLAEEMRQRQWAERAKEEFQQRVDSEEQAYTELAQKLAKSKAGATPEAIAALDDLGKSVEALKAELPGYNALVEQAAANQLKWTDESRKLSGAMDLAQVNLEYAELTGNIRGAAQAQLALIEATRAQKLANVDMDIPGLAEAYKRLYDEQARWPIL